ncbi:MAG: BBP7 family outer membrane beta-barrel protein [Pirellulaceae bacterium]|nr:BBP7 family outer membrane beta-barrel protein [Pirellulaceae bacterium]
MLTKNVISSMAAMVFMLTCFSPSLHAQVIQPFAPVDYTHDWQPFAPADLSDYGDGPDAKEGYFFRYERLYWSAAKPKATALGLNDGEFYAFAGTTTVLRQTNTVRTAVPDAGFGWGNRYEIGYMLDETGWFTSILGGYQQDQSYFFGDGGTGAADGIDDVSIVFADPGDVMTGFLDRNADGFDDDLNGNGIFGRSGEDTDADGVPDAAAAIDLVDATTLPMLFDFVTVRSRVFMNGVEVNKSWRLDPHYRDAQAEVFAGIRFLSIRDRFNVHAIGATIDSPLSDMFWASQVENNIIGPQIGFHWSKQTGRWKISTEGRAVAGVNFANAELDGVIATNHVIAGANFGQLMSTTPFSHRRNFRTITPVGELRANATYQLTDSIAFTGGWTGLYVGDISRGSQMMNYVLPEPNIVSHNPTESFFANGFNFGIDINR